MSALLEETVELPVLLLKNEVAEYLRCSVRTVERMLDAGALKKIGGGRAGGPKVLIPASSVEEWLAAGLSEAELAASRQQAQSPGPSAQRRLTSRSVGAEARVAWGTLVPITAKDEGARRLAHTSTSRRQASRGAGS